MHFTLYVESVTKTTGGTTGGSSGSSSSGSNGGSNGGSSSGSNGGSNGGSSSGSNGGQVGKSGGSSGTSNGGSNGGQVGKGNKPVTIKKSTELAKMPPVHVTQPNGSAIAMNMQDFCVLPNAQAINAAVYSQCVARKKSGSDDMPTWALVLIIGIVVVMVIGVILFVVASLRD